MNRSFGRHIATGMGGLRKGTCDLGPGKNTAITGLHCGVFRHSARRMARVMHRAMESGQHMGCASAHGLCIVQKWGDWLANGN